MNTSNSFYDTFYSKLEKVNQVLESYQNDPNEENIHDIRTSIRRLESAYSILPRSSITKESDKLIQKYKKFFSLNNKIRDLDIILEKLRASEYEQESILVLTLTKNKLERLSKTLKIAKKLSKMKKPKIKKVLKKNLKFEKTILFLIRKFQNYVPIVISDESKVDELHSMRKTIKKLRYVLELDPSDSYKNIVLQLKQLQQLLGNIHDCDIFIWHFEKKIEEIPKIKEIIDIEKSKRTVIYQKLVSALSDFTLK